MTRTLTEENTARRTRTVSFLYDYGSCTDRDPAWLAANTTRAESVSWMRDVQDHKDAHYNVPQHSSRNVAYVRSYERKHVYTKWQKEQIDYLLGCSELSPRQLVFLKQMWLRISVLTEHTMSTEPELG